MSRFLTHLESSNASNRSLWPSPNTARSFPKERRLRRPSIHTSLAVCWGQGQTPLRDPRCDRLPFFLPNSKMRASTCRTKERELATRESSLRKSRPLTSESILGDPLTRLVSHLSVSKVSKISKRTPSLAATGGSVACVRQTPFMACLIVSDPRGSTVFFHTTRHVHVV